MMISDGATALEYISDWDRARGTSAQSNARRFRRTAEDLMRSVRIMVAANQQGRRAYSAEEVADLREAVSLLRLAAERRERAA